MIKKLGFMQGRLLDSEKKNVIQYFPAKNWKLEFKLAKKNNFKIIEWTVNKENLKKNPIYNGKLDQVRSLMKKYNIKITSITNDYFMQKPFYKKKNFNIKKKIIKKLEKIILNGNKIDIKFHIFPLVDNGSIKSETEEKILIKEIKKLTKKIKKNSKILFETDYTPDRIIKFIKKFKTKKVCLNYDTGNSAALNYNFDDEIKYWKYVKNIHIKDRVLNGNTVRLGKGNWDYKKFFKLIKGKYRGNFILQTARSANNEHIKEILINKKFFENGFK
jgi:sugar phosphate isomerase/epimerase